MWLCGLLAFAGVPVFVLTYSPYYTHPDLTAQMAVLFNNKNSKDGIHISDQEIGWMREGAIEEDEPPRWINHFYDPVHGVGWQGNHAGTYTPEQALKEATDMSPLMPMPSIFWATNQQAQSVYRQFGNQTWQKAEWSYRDGDRASAFKALGHILHLIEDASVPDHTRGDTHSHLHGDPGSPYEDYSEQYTNTHALYYSDSLVSATVPAYASLSDAFRDIATYSNNHFFSEDTIDTGEFSEPNIVQLHSDNNYLYDTANNIYVAHIQEKGNEKSYSTDDRLFVLPSYRDHLLPHVIVTGAGVIQLFFDEIKKNAFVEPLVADKPTNLLDMLLTSPLGLLKLPLVDAKQTVYDQTISNATAAHAYLQGTYNLNNETSALLSSTPYSPTLFKPTTGTLSIAKENSSTKLIMGTVNNGPANYLVDSSNVVLPFVTNSAVVGTVEQYVLPVTDSVPGTAGFSSTLYAQAPAVLTGSMDDGEENILAQALRGIGVDSNPINAAATALLLTTAVAGLGYVVKARTENGVAVFDIVKTIPRTVYENVVDSANVLVPVTKQVVEYVTVPISEQYMRPVQVLKNVVETAYQWVKEAVPVLKQVAHTVYEYVTSWIPETVKGWLGGIWQSITNWVEKVVPIAKTVYDTVVETVYQWVQRPVAYVTQVMETVLKTATRMIEKTIPVVRDVVSYVSSSISNTYQRARTVYDEVVVGTIRAAETQPAAATPAVALPTFPPNLYRWEGINNAGVLVKNYSMLVNGVWHLVTDPESIEKTFGNILDRIPNASGMMGLYTTSGGAQTFLKSWQMMSDVFNSGSLPDTPEKYAAGVPGTGHQMGWVWKPVEMIDPRTNIIYSVDATEDAHFQDKLGWRRTDTGLFTNQQLATARRSFESYDTVENFLAHKQYHA